MKSTNTIINVVLLAAVVILYILHFTQPKSAVSEKEAKPEIETPVHIISDSSGNTSTFRIAHVNTDTILANYKYFLKKKKDLELRTNNADYQYQNKIKELEEYYKDLEYKVKMSLATEEEAQIELYKKQQEIEQYRQNLTKQLLNEEQDLTLRLYDSIVAHINKYNKGANYNYILGYSAGGGILYTDKTYDLTDIILKGLNAEEVVKQ